MKRYTRVIKMGRLDMFLNRIYEVEIVYHKLTPLEKLQERHNKNFLRGRK